MPQWFNPGAIKLTAEILLGIKSRGLLRPRMRAQSIGEIDYEKLVSQENIRAIIFDKDNTLTLPYALKLDTATQKALRKCTAAGITIQYIVSNHAGSPDDPGHSMAEQFEKCLGLPVIRHQGKKPLIPLDSILSQLSSSLLQPLIPQQIADVGDRVLTDVVWANSLGMYSILVEPLDITASSACLVPTLTRFERWLIL